LDLLKLNQIGFYTGLKTVIDLMDKADAKA
jgi:hypothetical protein